MVIVVLVYSLYPAGPIAYILLMAIRWPKPCVCIKVFGERFSLLYQYSVRPAPPPHHVQSDVSHDRDLCHAQTTTTRTSHRLHTMLSDRTRLFRSRLQAMHTHPPTMAIAKYCPQLNIALCLSYQINVPWLWGPTHTS